MNLDPKNIPEWEQENFNQLNGLPKEKANKFIEENQEALEKRYAELQQMAESQQHGQQKEATPQEKQPKKGKSDMSAKKGSLPSHVFNFASGAGLVLLADNADKLESAVKFATETWQNGLITGAGTLIAAFIAIPAIRNSKLCRTTAAAGALSLLAYQSFNENKDPLYSDNTSVINQEVQTAQIEDDFSKFEMV